MTGFREKVFEFWNQLIVYRFVLTLVM